VFSNLIKVVLSVAIFAMTAHAEPSQVSPEQAHINSLLARIADKNQAEAILELTTMPASDAQLVLAQLQSSLNLMDTSLNALSESLKAANKLMERNANIVGGVYVVSALSGIALGVTVMMKRPEAFDTSSGMLAIPRTAFGVAMTAAELVMIFGPPVITGVLLDNLSLHSSEVVAMTSKVAALKNRIAEERSLIILIQKMIEQEQALK
jgi:hypothetical protein